MNFTIRIPQALVAKILRDLERPHDVAFERVGFLYTRRSGPGGGLILATDYVPVPDDRYLPGDYVGARIQGAVIRETMQAILDQEVGVFHVHRHHHKGKPRFSWIDVKSLVEVLPAFCSVGPSQMHGALLFSEDDVHAAVWSPETKGLDLIEKVSIVGFPLMLSCEQQADATARSHYEMEV